MTDKICDCCPRQWTKELNSKTSKWCSAWFYGEYCDECFDIVEKYMQEEVERDKRSDLEMENLVQKIRNYS